MAAPQVISVPGAHCFSHTGRGRGVTCREHGKHRARKTAPSTCPHPHPSMQDWPPAKCATQWHHVGCFTASPKPPFSPLPPHPQTEMWTSAKSPWQEHELAAETCMANDGLKEEWASSVPSAHLLLKLPSPTFEMVSDFRKSDCQSGKDVCPLQGEASLQSSPSSVLWGSNLSAAAGSWQSTGTRGWWHRLFQVGSVPVTQVGPPPIPDQDCWGRKPCLEPLMPGGLARHMDKLVLCPSMWSQCTCVFQGSY